MVPKIVAPQALAGENTMTVVADEGPLFDASEAHPDAEQLEDISIQIDEIRIDTDADALT